MFGQFVIVLYFVISVYVCAHFMYVIPDYYPVLFDVLSGFSTKHILTENLDRHTEGKQPYRRTCNTYSELISNCLIVPVVALVVLVLVQKSGRQQETGKL